MKKAPKGLFQFTSPCSAVEGALLLEQQQVPSQLQHSIFRPSHSIEIRILRKW